MDALPAELSEIDLISGHFLGFGWGLVERDGQGWARRLGPDGSTTLLLRVPATCAVSLQLDGAACPPGGFEALSVSVNGRDPEPIWTGLESGKPSLRLQIDRDAVTRAEGCLQILFSMGGGLKSATDRQPVAFAKLNVRPG